MLFSINCIGRWCCQQALPSATGTPSTSMVEEEEFSKFQLNIQIMKPVSFKLFKFLYLFVFYVPSKRKPTPETRQHLG